MLKILKDSIYDALEEMFTTYMNLTEDEIIIKFKFNNLEDEQSVCAIQILNLTQIGRQNDSRVPIEVDGVYGVRLNSFYRATVQFTFMGKNSDEYGSEFDRYIVNNSEVGEIFRKHNLAILSKGQLIILPQLRDDKYIELTNVDVDFNFAITEFRETDYAETVIIDGTLGNQKINIG